MAPPGPALLCRGSTRVPSGPEAPTLKSHDRARYDWDVALGRIWVRVLLVGFFVPIGIRLHDEMRWIWPWTGLSDLGVARALLALLPLFLGVAAWIVLGLSARRLRGGLLFALCVGATLVPAGDLLRGSFDAYGIVPALTSAGRLAALVVLGCVFIAAGNRQQKRTLGRGLAPILTTIGGLAVLFTFFCPLLPARSASANSGPPVAAIFLEPDAWAAAWFFLIWQLGLLAYGLLGTLSLLATRLGDSFAVWSQGTLSRLARLLAISLPLITLGWLLAFGGLGIGHLFFLVIKGMMHGYSIVFLAAIGLARLLDDAAPDTVWMPLEEETESEPEAD